MSAVSFLQEHIFLTFSAFLFCMTSCEGNTRYEVWVSNQSDQTIRVEHRNRRLIEADSFFVASVLEPGEARLLARIDWLGGRADPAEPPEVLDSIAVFNEAEMQSSFPWRQPEVWIIESHHDRKIPSQWRHTYLNVVTESSFQ